MEGILDIVGQGVTGVHSSTTLKCWILGGGLDVTTCNIRLITPSMYAMALLAALLLRRDHNIRYGRIGIVYVTDGKVEI